MLIHQPDNSVGNYNENTYIYKGIEWYPHFHKNFEIAYVMAGTVSVTLREKTFTANSGEWIFVLSNQIHSYSGSPDSKTLVTVFSEDFVPKFRETVRGKIAENPIFSLNKDFGKYAISRLISDISVIEKKGIFYSVCAAFLESAQLVEKSRKSESDMLDILDYIEEHFKEPLTLEQLADRFGYERHYLSRLFNSTYKINFRRLINGYRVDAAKDFLSDRKMNITEISDACGFPSIRSMNYIFKEMTGQTPSEYAKSPYDVNSGINKRINL